MIRDAGAELGFPYCELFKPSKTLRFDLAIFLRVLYYSQKGDIYFLNNINNFVSTSEAQFVPCGVGTEILNNISINSTLQMI
jgi:hypothetical protein